MRIEQYYVAKDGTRFRDPFECERYEASLGKEVGTLGWAMEYLKTEKEQYVSGVALVLHKGNISPFFFVTMNIEGLLGDYVNVENLEEEKRYTICTVGEMIEILKNSSMDASDLCQFTLFISDTLRQENSRIFSFQNDKLWKERKAVIEKQNEDDEK